MAQRTQIILEDDLDGGPAEETLTLALDGVTVELDLSETNAQTLREALSRYMGAGRKVGGATTTRKRNRSSSGGSGSSDAGAIRAWARDNGYTVSERGRVSQEVRDAYHARAAA